MYKYEMHIHSEPCSGGGDVIERQIDKLIERGYSGMVTTNHFYYGDTRIDRSLAWEEFVDAYRECYERGKRYGDERGFDVLFGIEEHVGEGREILVYGINPELLVAHPELRCADAAAYARVVHEAGGVVFQAHPYRERYYITMPGPLECLDELDGIEVYNAGNKPEENLLAARLAEKKSLATVAGSDGHSTESCGRAGIVSKERIRTNEDLVRVLKSGEYEIWHT